MNCVLPTLKVYLHVKLYDASARYKYGYASYDALSVMIRYEFGIIAENGRIKWKLGFK